jgi:hypothetical protein
MSDPREFERDPNLPRNRYVETSEGTNSGWIIAAVVAIALLGLAAYSYRDTDVSSVTAPESTTGQNTRAPVPKTPPAAPVAPAPRTQPPQ